MSATTDDQDKAIREIAVSKGLWWRGSDGGKEVNPQILAALREACEWQREQDAKLRELCEGFIKEQTIRSDDSVWQCDWISEHSLELISDICKLIGYWDDDAEAIRRGGQNGL